jgi:hypothetical protein
LPIDYLHNHKDFPALLRIVSDETGIQSGLIEKDYWIMHVLYGLKQQGFEFELKVAHPYLKVIILSTAFQRISIFILNRQLIWRSMKTLKTINDYPFLHLGIVL